LYRICKIRITYKNTWALKIQRQHKLVDVKALQIPNIKPLRRLSYLNIAEGTNILLLFGITLIYGLTATESLEFDFTMGKRLFIYFGSQVL